MTARHRREAKIQPSPKPKTTERLLKEVALVNEYKHNPVTNTLHLQSSEAPSQASMSPPPAKRAKTDDALRILSPHILESENDLRQAYGDAKPYSHGRLENMFQTGFLGKK